MTQLRSVTCYMESHSGTCYPTQVNTPRLNPSHTAGTRFTYPGGMEGWLDLVDLIVPRPGVEPAIFRSRVQRSTTAVHHQCPSHRPLVAPYFCSLCYVIVSCCSQLFNRFTALYWSCLRSWLVTLVVGLSISIMSTTLFLCCRTGWLHCTVPHAVATTR